MFVGGKLFSRCLSVCLSVSDILVFQYLEKVKKAMTEFDIRKMDIYDRKIRARGQFF